jgi:hypothetical protein
LKFEDSRKIQLAKVNGPHNLKLQRKTGIQGYPSLVMYIHGKPKIYPNTPFKKSNMKLGPVLKFIRQEIENLRK